MRARQAYSALMKTKYSFLLWVSNMSVVGADSDYTVEYLSAAGADDIAAKHGVTLDEQTISSHDAERLWQAYREMAVAVADAGHGGDTEDAPAPTLTAYLPAAKYSAAAVQRMVSQTATSYAQWAAEALIEVAE